MLHNICTPWPVKNMAFYFCAYLRQLLIDLQNFFSLTFSEDSLQ